MVCRFVVSVGNGACPPKELWSIEISKLINAPLTRSIFPRSITNCELGILIHASIEYCAPSVVVVTSNKPTSAVFNSDEKLY